MEFTNQKDNAYALKEKLNRLDNQLSEESIGYFTAVEKKGRDLIYWPSYLINQEEISVMESFWTDHLLTLGKIQMRSKPSASCLREEKEKKIW